MPPRPPTRRRSSPPPSWTIVPCVALAADLDGLPSIAFVYGLETKKRAAACQHAIPAPHNVTVNDDHPIDVDATVHKIGDNVLNIARDAHLPDQILDQDGAVPVHIRVA